MKRRLSTLLLALLLAVFASASAEEILYTGTVSKPMTIRAKKSTSAAKLGSVETGELINIIEYGSARLLSMPDSRLIKSALRSGINTDPKRRGSGGGRGL